MKSVAPVAWQTGNAPQRRVSVLTPVFVFIGKLKSRFWHPPQRSIFLFFLDNFTTIFYNDLKTSEFLVNIIKIKALKL